MSEPHNPLDVRGLSAADLGSALLGNVSDLVKEQVKLARVELEADLRSAASAARYIAAAAAIAIVAASLLLVALIFGLGQVVPQLPLAVGLGASLAVLAAGLGFVGIRRVPKQPLARTRGGLQKEIEWTMERLT